VVRTKRSRRHQPLKDKQNSKEPVRQTAGSIKKGGGSGDPTIKLIDDRVDIRPQQEYRVTRPAPTPAAQNTDPRQTRQVTTKTEVRADCCGKNRK